MEAPTVPGAPALTYSLKGCSDRAALDTEHYPSTFRNFSANDSGVKGF